MENPQQKPIIDKLPPSAIDLEEIVLGALIVEPKAIEKINLIPGDFYKHEHELIFKAIKQLNEERKQIDMFTVCERLKKNKDLENAGGSYYITLLTTKISSAAHIEQHSLIIKQKVSLRRLIRLSSDIQEKSYSEDDLDEITELFDKNFTEIKTGNSKSSSIDVSDAISKTIKHYEKIQQNKKNGIDLAITTGLKDLDLSLNGGWFAPDLIVIAGRPGMGKTQFALKFAKSAAQTKNTLFISLEMNITQLITRYITENENINFYNIKTGQLNSEEWNSIDCEIKSIEKLKLSISDEPEIENLSNIVSLLRKKKRDGKLDFAIIDYLQLIRTSGKFGSRQQEVGNITKTLKSLARELNVPIMILAQLGRPKDGTTPGKLPQLHELREAGDIEQDADIVIFIHRPEYYGIEFDKDQNSWHNRGILIPAKNREGIKDEHIYFKHDENFKKIIGKDENFNELYSVINPNKNIEPNKDFETETPF